MHCLELKFLVVFDCAISPTGVIHHLQYPLKIVFLRNNNCYLQPTFHLVCRVLIL
jgi:hypothetical protein